MLCHGNRKLSGLCSTCKSPGHFSSISHLSEAPRSPSEHQAKQLGMVDADTRPASESLPYPFIISVFNTWDSALPLWDQELCLLHLCKDPGSKGVPWGQQLSSVCLLNCVNMFSQCVLQCNSNSYDSKRFTFFFSTAQQKICYYHSDEWNVCVLIWIDE